MEPIRQDELRDALVSLWDDVDRATAASGARAEVPAALADRVAARARRARDVARRRSRRWRAAASTTRSAAASRATRSTRPGPCPHFEKMLYDNALLARAYLHGWQVSGEERLREVCCETLDWALREMRGPEGGFCSALDADSEGVEGKFYVWTLAELREALGSELADEAIAYFGATERGNFEHGTNVLEARGPAPAQTARRDPPPAARGPLAAGAPRARRQAPDLVERADDLRARRCRRRARARRLPRRRPAAAPSSCSASCATPTAGCCAPGRTAGRGSPPTSRTTRSCSRRCIALYEATVRAALVPRGGRARRRDDRALRRPRARRLLHDRAAITSARAGARTSRTRRSRRATRRPRSGCCGWRGCPARASYERHALGVLRLHVPARGPPSAARSATCSRRSTSTSRRSARSRSSAGRRGGGELAAASCRGVFRPHVVLAGGGDGRRAAARGARAGRRPRRRVRLRALRLPGAGDTTPGALLALPALTLAEVRSRAARGPAGSARAPTA